MSLSKTLYPLLSTGSTQEDLSCFLGCKESNQTKHVLTVSKKIDIGLLPKMKNVKMYFVKKKPGRRKVGTHV